LLVLNKSSEEDVFREELQKFQPHIDRIKHNIETTSTLLKELRSCHNKLQANKSKLFDVQDNLVSYHLSYSLKNFPTQIQILFWERRKT